MGDAYGAAVEFWSLERIVQQCGPDGVTELLPAYGVEGGAITDDTQMTLFTVEGLVAAASPADRAASVEAAYRRWYSTQTSSPTGAETGLAAEGWLWAPRAPGNTCMSALAPVVAPGAPAANDSKGCGTVMRSAPYGFTDDPIGLATSGSLVTHGHPTATVSAAYLAAIVASLAEGDDLATAVATARAAVVDTFGDTHHETTGLVDRAVALAVDGPPSPAIVESLGGAWVAEEALAISVLVALTATDWADALRRAVTHSGDSDSTGAIVGNLLGAWWGDTDLPARWLAVLEGRATIERLADALAAAD